MTSKIDILKQELTKPEYQELVIAQNYPAVAQLLNNRLIIPNPIPQENVWKCPQILELTAGTRILGTATNQIVTIGTLATTVFPFNGGISELIFFSLILSISDRQTLERDQGQYYEISVN